MKSFGTAVAASGSRIASLGEYRPSRIVTNDQVSENLAVDDRWIRERVGVQSRRFATDESVIDMAVIAAEKALANSGVARQDIDLVVLATCSPPSPVPNNASAVAAQVCGGTLAAFDLNTACSGFCYGLAVVDGLIRAGTIRHAIVVGSEKMTDWVDPTDVHTSVIFADGAGAAVVSVHDSAHIGPVVWGSDGSRRDLIAIADRTQLLTMQGPSVYRWAVESLAPIALEACNRAGIAPEDLAAFIPHQANLRIIDGLVKKVNAKNAVVARNIVESGNTSAASIPLAFSGLIEQRAISSGDPVLLFGFGAGLSWAAQVVRCP